MYSDNNNRVQYSENYVYTQYDFYFYNGNAMMKDEEIRLSHLLKYCEISDMKINEFSVDDFNLVAMVNI
jgi:tartrate dehydratase beta subunit/fumarate hydratase class I family protein